MISLTLAVLNTGMLVFQLTSAKGEPIIAALNACAAVLCFGVFLRMEIRHD